MQVKQKTVTACFKNRMKKLRMTLLLVTASQDPKCYWKKSELIGSSLRLNMQFVVTAEIGITTSAQSKVENGWIKLGVSLMEAP